MLRLLLLLLLPLLHAGMMPRTLPSWLATPTPSTPSTCASH
jgi:hypothetical protein